MNWPQQVWVANQGAQVGNVGPYYNSSIEEFSTSGVLLHTFINGVSDAVNVATDSQGNIWVANFNNSTLEKFNPSLATSSSVTDSSTQITVTDTVKQTTVSPNNNANNPTVIQSAHTGDTLTLADALQFNANAVTAANVTAAGGSVTTLAGWINGALNAKGANEASHSIDWFNFNGNTYLLEQAHAQGSAYGTGDTLVQLVGVFNESHAGFTGHWRVNIQRKAAKGKPLSECQKKRNTRIAQTRARVEHVFASLEHMGGKGLRCIGLARATLQLNFKAAAYNLRRLCSLKTCGIKPAFAF